VKKSLFQRKTGYDQKGKKEMRTCPVEGEKKTFWEKKGSPWEVKGSGSSLTARPVKSRRFPVVHFKKKKKGGGAKENA